MPKSEASESSHSVKVKRELWKGKAYSVARNEKGHFVSIRKWKGKTSTEAVHHSVQEKIPEHSIPKEYSVKRKPVSKPIQSGTFVYVVMVKEGDEYHRTTITKYGLYDMKIKENREYIYSEIRRKYKDYDFEIDDMYLEWVYDAHTGQKLFVMV